MNSTQYKHTGKYIHLDSFIGGVREGRCLVCGWKVRLPPGGNALGKCARARSLVHRHIVEKHPEEARG